MEEQQLDFVLVPTGLALMVAYHMWLLYRLVKHPTKTAMGINAFNRKIWVHAMMKDPKNGIVAVQTLRNNIMASTLVASTAIFLSSMIAVLMAGNPTTVYNNSVGVSNSKVYGFVYGNKSHLEFSVKAFSILLCFLLAFLMNVQSIRYFSHASILINVGKSRLLTPDYVARAVNRGGYFWSLGLRALYFSCPLFLWIFGPIPMCVCCFVLVFLLYFLDVSFYETVGDENEEMTNGEG